jgi:thiol-disulfide isomerase/thioredoxin
MTDLGSDDVAMRPVDPTGGDAARFRRRLLLLMAASAAAIVAVVLALVALKPGSGPTTGPDPTVIGIGSMAPDFALPDLLSTRATPLPPVALASLGKDRHRPVVLNFFASWCTPCRKETPLLAATAAVEARRGSPVQFIGVAVADDPAQAIPFVTGAGVTYPVGADANLRVAADVYGLADEPATFFIDAAGVVVGRHLGALSADELRSELARLTPVGSPASGPDAATPGVHRPRLAAVMRTSRF